MRAILRSRLFHQTVKSSILVADDEPDVLNLIGSNLRHAGFHVTLAADGALALAHAQDEKPALIILDIMMPEISGLDVCKVLKSESSTRHIPIILLSARTAEIDRVLGFELGAEDYVTKPFSPRELVLRVQRLLNRQTTRREALRVLSAEEIVMDLARHEVTIHGRRLELTPIEFKLLQALMESPGNVRSRDDLLKRVWGYDQGLETRTVDTHVRRLRDKLGESANRIQTVRSFGYRLEVSSAD
jgi:DNA-binding response OmpR family regulator